MDAFTVTRWPADAGQVTINKIRARLEQEGLSPSRFDMIPGDSYPDHSHPDDEIRWVVSGQMRVCIGSEQIDLGPGDRLDLAPKVTHSANVVGDDVVVTVAASR